MNPANIEIDMVRKYSGYARGICTALLALLAAVISIYLWIMHVGLGARREADQLKREAELVV